MSLIVLLWRELRNGLEEKLGTLGTSHNFECAQVHFFFSPFKEPAAAMSSYLCSRLLSTAKQKVTFPSFFHFVGSLNWTASDDCQQSSVLMEGPLQHCSSEGCLSEKAKPSEWNAKGQNSALQSEQSISCMQEVKKTPAAALRQGEQALKALLTAITQWPLIERAF